jgi:hypothetical protein
LNWDAHTVRTQTLTRLANKGREVVEVVIGATQVLGRTPEVVLFSPQNSRHRYLYPGQ